VAELSPAAQAVLANYHKEAIDYIESWGSFSHKRGMAAALRAAANQAHPKAHIEDIDYVHQNYVHGWKDALDVILAIADELDNTSHPS
jgi:hypothetical protein